MYIRSKKVKGFIYLQLVESRREGKKTKQIILKSLGRLDTLRANGQLDGLLRSGAKFSERLAVLDAHEKGQSKTINSISIGVAVVFEKIWKQSGIDVILGKKQKDRKFEFSMGRAIFLTVLHRLCVSGSDRAAEEWKKNHAISGAEKIELHHLYRAMAWLGEELDSGKQAGRTPFSPRCVKDEIEEELFKGRRDLFSGLALVFFDTTSLYFEGNGGNELGDYGHSKDHRPDLKQMVVGIILDEKGNPLCSELWPGNTADVKTLVPVAERLKKRFGIERVCVVADRGMISGESKRQITQLGWEYILGVRMRLQNVVKEEILSRGGRYEQVYPVSANKKDPAPLKVKEVNHDGQRYIICVNETEAVAQQEMRQTIVAGLRDKLKSGEKQLIGNKGYRRYLKAEGDSHFVIDEEKIKEEARYDGKWVLTSNTKLTASEVALKYKQLWTVEAIFRTMKSVLESRPVYHKCDEAIRGHVFCSFLALVLRKQLQDALEQRGWNCEWEILIRDLEKLCQIEVSFSGKKYLLRTDTQGDAGKAIQAVGAMLPGKVVQQ